MTLALFLDSKIQHRKIIFLSVRSLFINTMRLSDYDTRDKLKKWKTEA